MFSPPEDVKSPAFYLRRALKVWWRSSQKRFASFRIASVNLGETQKLGGNDLKSLSGFGFQSFLVMNMQSCLLLAVKTLCTFLEMLRSEQSGRIH